MLPGTILDHVRACRIHIAEEQRKPNPDTALIATLCDAVRFAREHVNEKKERAKATPYQHGERRTVAGVRPASINDQSARLNPPAERLADDFPRFACDKCGKLRTKAEGGEVWTTCEGYGRNCDGSSERPAGEAPHAHGLYELTWKDGGTSLAAVGSDAYGRRWYAPTNWITVPCFDWDRVRSWKPISSERTARTA
jgi:hypothetical protein